MTSSWACGRRSMTASRSGAVCSARPVIATTHGNIRTIAIENESPLLEDLS